ncbi:hypothetical protein FGADI_10400 [Fusarium gaditjirri]|uniref:Uncharacterized protein n=1 Tax=Fusarium gaditjirri TaxID=282569 RepID=A0A8H4WQU3_9HYPO|nr:hypothetical protein FGADI_10400 [Fusarium gaditjirri]
MSFTSLTGQFKPYQAFGSGSSSKPPAQSFSSRVDFSDQSYYMPYFAGSDGSEGSGSNPLTNYASTALKQLSDAPKTKSFDKKRLSTQPSQPLEAKIDYTEFLKSLEFSSTADSKISHGSGYLCTRLFKSILRQLVPQVPEVFKGIKDRNAQERADEMIKALPKTLRTNSVSIYIESLNYSEGETAPKLVQDFSKLVEKSQIPTKDPTTTHGLRIIFSSTL